MNVKSMTIEQIKELFDNKNVKLKLDKYIFENLKLKFVKNSVIGYDNNDLKRLEITHNTFMQLVSNVEVSIIKEI